jgi:hypothetical protein
MQMDIKGDDVIMGVMLVGICVIIVQPHDFKHLSRWYCRV